MPTMHFRQSLLKFGAPKAATTSTAPMSISQKRPLPARADSSVPSEMGDTIVVAAPEDPPLQLPTPSESTTDVSSQGTDYMSMKEVPKGRGKRVNKRLTKSRSENCLLDSTEDDMEQNRTVSGETLVNSAAMSQTSLMQQGISALNLPWSMSEVFNTGSKAELIKGKDADADVSMDTIDTVVANAQEDEQEDEQEDGEEEEDPEAEKERLANAAAKKAKMEDNKRLREEKQKAADEKATRRSSRASMLTKAGDMVSDLASTVLGKRKSRVEELRENSRPQSAMDSISTEEPLEEAGAKRRRFSESDTLSIAQIARNIKARRPRDKKWLPFGLYAGQPSTFNPLLHESKNKKKSVTALPIIEKENKVLPLPMFAGERLLKDGRDFKLPFDVFSPLPPGQPKPDEWRKSNKNTFVGDAQAEWRINKFDEHSTCMCKPATGCDSDCFNRLMYYECDDRNCNLTSEQCGNRAFADLARRAKRGGKFNVGVEVIKTIDRGHGVRSNRMFAPNQIIVEYSGEIVTQEECEKRMHKQYKDNECYYLMLFDQNMIIDATTKGSIARFVNHSCAPNCRMEKWTVGGQPRMALFAGDRGIMTGEELTYDYNFDPYSQKNVQECRCGEERCRGILGPKEKKGAKKEDPKDESKMKGVKRKVLEVVEESTGRLNKRKKVEIKAVVYDRPNASASPSPVKVLKKTVRRTSTPMKATAGLERKPSKLKRVFEGAKAQAAKAKAAGISRTGSRRAVSSSSASHALLEREIDTHDLSRSQSLKEKVGTMKDNVVKTVRGARGGQTRTMRMVNAIEV